MQDTVAEISKYSKSELDKMNIAEWCTEAELCLSKAKEKAKMAKEASKGRK